jgi:hypothetical protein
MAISKLPGMRLGCVDSNRSRQITIDLDVLKGLCQNVRHSSTAAALPYVQSSIRKPGTRLNSRTLCVIRRTSRRTAWAAISRSIEPPAGMVMTNQHLRTLVLAGILCGSFLTATYGQLPISRPELLAGPWEFAGPSGIEGIFFSIGTHAGGTADQPIVTSQTVNIRVYHRHGGHETWGWYSTTPAGPGDAPSVFDGQHLRLRSIRNGPALDLTFDAETHRWTGTWSREGQLSNVVLERPRPPLDVVPNAFKGTGRGSGLPLAS